MAFSLGNLFGGGSKPNKGGTDASDKNTPNNEPLSANQDLFNQTSRFSGIHRPTSPASAPTIGSYQSSMDRIGAQARLNPKSRAAKMEENALNRKKTENRHTFFGQNSVPVKNAIRDFVSDPGMSKYFREDMATREKRIKTGVGIFGKGGYVRKEDVIRIKRDLNEGRLDKIGLSPKMASKIKNSSGAKRALERTLGNMLGKK